MKSESVFTLAKELLIQHRKAATAAATAEVALVSAEADLAQASIDDGKIDVAKLDARIAAAQTPARLAVIAANRAGAALATIEEEISTNLAQIAEEAQRILTEAAGHARAEIIGELSPRLLNPGNPNVQAILRDAVSEFAGVCDREDASREIGRTLYGWRVNVASADEVLAAVEAAAKFTPNA